MIRLFILLLIGPSLAWSASRTMVPGTGVTISVPASFSLAPVGPSFVEPSGQTFIQILIGRKEHATEKGQYFHSLYPVGPIKIENGTTHGRLYKRTRAENGGGWDGWSYNVIGSESALTIAVMYTGADKGWFESFEHIFQSVTWDESKLDSEVSFGAAFSVPGLRVVPRQSGGILYTPNGEPGTPSPSLLIQALPIPPSKAGTVFPSACESAIKKVFIGEPSTGVQMFEGNGISGCDAWSTSSSAKMVYTVLFRTSDGGVLSGIGAMPVETAEQLRLAFRKAVTEIRRVRKISAQPIIPPDPSWHAGGNNGTYPGSSAIR
jgi:hypothetical protein